ncbi:hypothetical protein L211DRAFT_642695 [Terfezia boudieri ATCC MYA-4762]|uniref:Uncharacterized protein n=1 Tax=Terfezia boudieri ATCC MYA-4762 TaxID=1051890 RepID=A0A3N4L8P0_9PEZI|nr:hypothetical protein L211DRAFT_642695 [Terfezia boudieri ATCC MYA-4762]
MAEEARVREEMRLMELERVRIEEEWGIEEARLAEEARIALEKKLAKEEARRLEQERISRELCLAEVARQIEESRIAREQALFIEQAHRIEQARIAREQYIAEEQARKDEGLRIAREAEEAHLAEEAQLMEEARIAEEVRITEEEARIARERYFAKEEARRLEAERVERERVEIERREQERRDAEEREARRVAGIQALKEQEDRLIEEAKVVERRTAEEKRVMEEERLAEVEAERATEEARCIEEERLREEEHQRIQEEHLREQQREREIQAEQGRRMAEYRASLLAATALQARRAEQRRREEEERIALEALAVEKARVESEAQAETERLRLEKEEKQRELEEMEAKKEEEEKRRLEIEQAEREQKEKQEALQRKLHELLEVQERQRAEQLAAYQIQLMLYQRQQERLLQDACEVPLPEHSDEVQSRELFEEAISINTDPQITDRSVPQFMPTLEQEQEQVQERQRQEREASPESRAGVHQRSQEHERIREEERRKEIENVRQAFGFDEIAALPEPDNLTDLVDNDSDSEGEHEDTPPPPLNLADLLDGPDGILAISDDEDADALPKIKIYEAPESTGSWAAPWPIPRLIEIVPTPAGDAMRGPPRVFVEGTGFIDGKPQSRPQTRGSDRAKSPTLEVPGEGYDYFGFVPEQSASALPTEGDLEGEALAEKMVEAASPATTVQSTENAEAEVTHVNIPEPESTSYTDRSVDVDVISTTLAGAAPAPVYAPVEVPTVTTELESYSESEVPATSISVEKVEAGRSADILLDEAKVFATPLVEQPLFTESAVAAPQTTNNIATSNIPITTDTETEAELQTPSESGLAFSPKWKVSPDLSLTEIAARPLPAERSNSWDVVNEAGLEGNGAEAPKQKYATFPGTPSDISPPGLVSPEPEVQLPRFTEQQKTEPERQKADEDHYEDHEDEAKDGGFSLLPTVLQDKPDQVAEEECEREQKPRTPEERAQAVEEDYEFIACATAAAEFSGFDSGLVLDHRVPVHRGLAYQPSMEEIADEEQGGVIPAINQRRGSPIQDWTAPTPTRETPTRETPTRSSTYRDAVDEFPALSRWQKKNTLISQQQQQGQDQQRRNAEVRRQRLISYPSDSTMASTAASDYTITDEHAQSYKWDEPITSSQSVSRRGSIADIPEVNEEALGSGQVTPSDLTPTPSTIALDSYMASRRGQKSTATNHPPAPESTWGGDSGLGDDLTSRLSFSQPSTLGYSASHPWDDPNRSLRRRRGTFDSTFGREQQLKRSSMYDSSESLNMSADDSEISIARKEGRLRRKQEREAPLDLGSLLTREETIDALENRPKSAFEEKVKMFDKPDAREIFPLPEGMRTRNTSPTHDLTVRRALFDQPPIPIRPSEDTFKKLKRATSWGPEKKSSSLELSTTAAAMSPFPSFAPPARASTISPEPSKSMTPTTTSPNQSVASAPRNAPSLFPPSPPPAYIDDEIDDELSSTTAASQITSTASTLSRASSQFDFGNIPRNIPADANSWGRKLGKYFKGPAVGLLEKAPKSPGEKSRVDGDLDDDEDAEGEEEDGMKTPRAEPLSRRMSFVPVEESIREEHEVETSTTEYNQAGSTLSQLLPDNIQQPTTNAASPLSPEVKLGASSADASGSWSDYFAGVRRKVVEVGGKAAGKAAEALAEITTSPGKEQQGSAARDLASESAEFASALEKTQQTASQAPLAETPAVPPKMAWRDVQGEMRDDVKPVAVVEVKEEIKPIEAPEEREQEAILESASLQLIPEPEDDEDPEEGPEDKEARALMAQVILDTIMEESEEEYEYYDIVTGKVYATEFDLEPEPSVVEESVISEVQTEITGEGSTSLENTMRGLESMRSMDSIRSTASTRRRRKKNKKRKSLTGMFGEGPAPGIKEEENTAENKKEQTERVMVNEAEGEIEKVKPVEEEKKVESKQMVEGEDGPMELGKQSHAEVSLVVGLGNQATMNVNVSHPEAAPEEIHTMGNVPVPEAVQEASKPQPEKPKNRLRGLMSRAIKIKARSNVGGQSGETSPTEPTPTAGSSRTTPPSPTTALPRPSRKNNVPGLARISDELSLWMTADKNIKDPNALPSRYSQSMPSLIPTPSSSRPPVLGGSRRESMDYPSSGQESPVEQLTEAGPASSRTPTWISKVPRLRRTMTEPTVPRGELPMKHYPASTDDIPNYESRTPLRPSQTIRLVDPDPEEAAAAAQAKAQSSPLSHRFGFRTPSQSSLTSSSFRDSVDDTRPTPATSGGAKMTSASLPTLGYLSDNSPSGLGLFKAKTWGFDKEKSKERKEKKEEKKAEKEKEKKSKDKDGKKKSLFGMKRGFSFGKDKKEGKGSASAGEEVVSSGYTTDEGSMEERNRSRVSFDVVDGVTMGTTNVERKEVEVDDNTQNYSNTPSTPVGMRESLVMPIVDFTQPGTWGSNSPAASVTPESLSSSVGSLKGQSPVENAQMEGGYIFRPLSTVMEVPSASPTPAPQLLPKFEEKHVPASIPEDAAPVPEPAAEASEAEEYSHSDNDEEHSSAGSSTHLTPLSTLRKKLSARSLKTLKKKQRRRREEGETHQRERRGSAASLQAKDNRSIGDKQTTSTSEAAPIENPVAHAPAPPPAAANPHLDKSSAAAEGTTTSFHPTILDGSSIAPSSEAEAADKDEPVAAQKKLEGEAQAQVSPGAPDAEADAPVEDQEGAKLKWKKSTKGRKGAGEIIDTDPAIVSAERDFATASATQDRAIEALVTEPSQETEKAETETIARDQQLPTEFAKNTGQFIQEPESDIANISVELPPIPEDKQLINLPLPPPIPIDAAGEDTTLSRSGSKKNKFKSRRSSAISLAEELEAAGEEVIETATSSVHNTRPSSPTPSEDSFIVGDDAGSGGEPKIQRSGSKKKKKSGSQRRKERALKRASVGNLQQASQDVEQAAEKKPESIELPPQVPAEGFKSPEQSTAGGGVKLDAGTPFFEKTEKESARSRLCFQDCEGVG